MDKKSKEEKLIEKLEAEFVAFQKQWVKFVNNDFHHLTANVDTLVTQVGKLQTLAEQTAANVEGMDKRLDTGLETNKYIVRMLERL